MMSSFTCARCNFVGPITPHGNWRGFKLGLRVICKPCYYKEYAEKHKKTIAETKRRWVEADIPRFKETQKRWTSKNNKKILARTRKYQTSKLNATPKWLTKDQNDKLIEIYVACPPGYEVDHIIPLQGKNVRGLHVPWNLQYLPVTLNRSKGNRCA